ncbi:DUF342 domain-containing protein [Thermosediminibacter oceani]|uniref:Flagellar Assembly Protein A N-terminal region domain-containing protein n=1 Tax=Thermosediminibacter oceani (strain ATCC BAA-1034 / DSM 16646 / JW/IW-1228P) TaxID=555079 RepID=D9S3B0_THEOJ|nr:FapA family protein [Thermosediminibacter oceani]ADL07887.1 protein of unknown function DUF342 [Thermosediminibacter oceani DSM 16646]
MEKSHASVGGSVGYTKEDNINSQINIEISKDEMSAVISLSPPKGGEMLGLEDIISELNKKGIKYGIDVEKIKEMLDKGIFGSRIQVAKGLEPKAGRDGEIKYYFEVHKNLKPKIAEDGRVDFRDLGFITNVAKGQLLAEIIPPEKGVPGKTVTGKTLPAKDGKEVKFRTGKNVILSEDKSKIFSGIDGHPVIFDGQISVLPVMEIRGDVGPATGNIDFVGGVKIYGNIKSGYKVKAKGDVEVEGYVESAEIISGGTVLLKRGIQGMGKGFVKAAQDVVAKYIENSTVEAGQNIIVYEAIMHSYISAGNRIEVTGKKGQLVGGSAKAGEEIIAKIIGSPMATYTEVEVGINPSHKKKLQEINENLEYIKSSLEKIKKAVEVLEKLRNKESLTPDKIQMLKKLKDSEAMLRHQQEDLIKEKEKLQYIIKSSVKAKVSAYNAIYPGVNIVIGNASMKLKDKVEHATFYNHEGQIKFGTYEGR